MIAGVRAVPGAKHVFETAKGEALVAGDGAGLGLSYLQVDVC